MPIRAAAFVREKGFHFVSIPKTATNSIWRELLPNTTYRPFQHVKASAAKRWFVDDAWDSLFKFACVRSPYDIVRSWYSFHKTHPELSSEVHDFYSLSFEDWVLKENFKTHWENDEHLSLNPLWDGSNPLHQKSWVVGKNDSLLVNEILRFDDLSNELRRISDRVQINGSLEHLNAGPGASSIELSGELKSKIYETFKEDFSFFGFSED